MNISASTRRRRAPGQFFVVDVFSVVCKGLCNLNTYDLHNESLQYAVLIMSNISVADVLSLKQNVTA